MVMGLCLRRFCSNMNVGWKICLLCVGLWYDELLRGMLFRNDLR